jgi:hypothetical protein
LKVTMIDMGLKSLDHYLNTHKKYIQIICTSIHNVTDYRIEYEDLYQEALLELVRIYKNKEPLDVNFTRIRIKRYLLNNMLKHTKGRITKQDIDNLFHGLEKKLSN